MSSGARINVTNAMGGLLYHSNEDIWPICGAPSPSFMLASGIDVAPAYLEKLSKSAAVSKTEAGGGARDNGMHGNEASGQKAQLKFNQPTQRGPAITVHEWTDESGGVVYFSMKSPSRHWHCQQDDGKNKKTAVSALVRQRVGVAESSTRLESDRRVLVTACARRSSVLPVTTPRILPVLSISLSSVVR